jgi:hypothetical protein
MRLLKCRSLVDIGCGDWNWMKLHAFEFDYTGVDIVPEVIAANQKYARNNVRFLTCDVIRAGGTSPFARSVPLPSADRPYARRAIARGRYLGVWRMEQLVAAHELDERGIQSEVTTRRHHASRKA